MPIPELCADVHWDVTAAARAERFIANVTHEMNRPLTTFSDFSELMAGGKVKAEKVPDREGHIRGERGFRVWARAY